MIIRGLFGIYVALRFSEAGELAHVAYTESHSLHLAASVVFCFVFGLAVVLVGVTRLGERVAVIWHAILELLLVPLSVYFAWKAAATVPAPGLLLAGLTFDERFVVMLVVFAVIQTLLAIAGLHVVKWISKN